MEGAVSSETQFRCSNDALCKTTGPEWKKGLCMRCAVFGRALTMRAEVECPVCFDVAAGVEYPRCNHAVCVPCFKRCFCYSEEPTFPYAASVEAEYAEDPENPKWKRDYPLIAKYDREFCLWDDARQEKNETERHLRCCPLCRK